jgi:glycosyltransferase involved in cell wall biosynthesis
MWAETKPRVLYVVYWGAAEPLGQSLVLPAVKRLAASGAKLTLLTFEKHDDLARHSAMARIRASLDGYGIEWIPLRYHKRPKVPATLYDILRGVASGVVARLRTRPDIIHARTFIGGLIGLTLAPLVGARWIYHNEGFYPDEQVDGGVWKKGSRTHRIASFFEQQMYARADGIITMSHRGKCIIELSPAVQRKGSPVIVVPSCVDLDAFRRSQPGASTRSGALRLAYVGSVGGRYLLDKVGRFVEIASREFDSVHLQVLTRAEPSLVASMLSAGGLADEKWSVDSVPHDAVPTQLANQDAGLFFLSQGLSEHGCSPTKIGEYWAMGLPVVTTPNVSDIDDIIRRERVGVIVSEDSDFAYRRAAVELRSLLADKELRNRCRRAAEMHYALEPACDRQLTLYHELISPLAQETVKANVADR